MTNIEKLNESIKNCGMIGIEVYGTEAMRLCGSDGC